MAKEEEFAMIEELQERIRIEFTLQNANISPLIQINRVEEPELLPKMRNLLLWNKHEFKAFIDELLVLHSKMK